MAAKGNWTKSLFIGLWTVLNFTRKLFFNLIFIVIFVGLIVAIAGQDNEQLTVNKGSALFLTLNGKLVIEKESVDPFEQFLQESLGTPLKLRRRSLDNLMIRFLNCVRLRL